MNPDRIAEAVYTVIPDVLHQLFLTHRPSLMHHQIFQNARLLTCECQGLPVDGSGAGACVERQLPAGQQHGLLGELPQSQAADAGLQLSQVKGFCKIVVGPGIQPLNLVLHLAACGENQHPRLAVCLPQGAQHGHAVLSRQVQIKKYQIVALHTQKFQRLFPVVAVVHTVCQAPQTADNRLA